MKRIDGRMYLIYDTNDNYIFEGNLKELCEKFNRKSGCMRSTISRILNGKRDTFIVKGKHYKIYLSEE